MKFHLQNCCLFLYGIICSFTTTYGVRHARNLIWTQTPALKMGVSRIVGIEGDPSEWVSTGNVQVRHISAPHVGWQFKGLAFNYATQTLYWTESTNKKIQGLKLNGTTETQTIYTGTSSMAEGLAVDWLSNNVYWADSLYNWIIVAPLSSSDDSIHKLIVRTGLSSPHSIAVHPQKGYLFWTDVGTEGKIEVSDLLGQHRRVLVGDDIDHPRGIAIDFDDQRLYWVDSKKDTIECADFNGNNRRVVAYQAGTLFFGLAVFENYVFVTEQVQGHLRIYDKMTGKNEINYQLGYIPDGIVMYDNTTQDGNSSACEDAGCHHLCFNDPLAGPICRCGEGFLLENDGISCTASNKFSTPSHIYSIRDAICQYPVNLPDMSLYNVTLDSQCFLQNGRGYLGLTYEAREHVLYYAENVTNSIGRINMEFGESGDTILKGVGEVQGMALDWVSGNLYWTDMTYNHISVARKDGSYPVVVKDNLEQPLGIVLDPQRGLMYWSEQGTKNQIYRAAMDGSQTTVIVNNTLCDIPNHLFLDVKSQKLYWADSGFYSIRMIDLNSMEMEIVYENILQSVTFFGISIYQDYILWTDKDDVKNGVHAARADKREKVRGMLHPHVGLASDLVTFDPEHQPFVSSPCNKSNGYCDHICLPTSISERMCACGVGFVLDETNLRSCISEPKADNFVVTVDSYLKKVYQIGVNDGEVSALRLDNKYKGVAVDTNPVSSKVYWTDNKAFVIMEAQVDGFGETVFSNLPNGSVSDGLAVDYINQLLFYTCTYADIIVVVSLKDPRIYRTIINESLSEPRDIVVHPETGMIYWTDWGDEPKIEMATMDGGNRSELLNFGNDSWPNGLALDVNTLNLFWVDAKRDIIGRINLQTKIKKIILSEPKAHYFGITLMNNFIYVTDWLRKYVSRIPADGGELEQVGPAKFARLNGIASYRKSDIRTAFSVCLLSTCSNLCVPVSEKNYRCLCSDEGKYGPVPCRELNEIGISVTVSKIQQANKRNGSSALVIGLSVLGVITVLCLAVAGIYIYNKKMDLYWSWVPGLPRKLYWPVRVISWDGLKVKVFCKADNAMFRTATIRHGRLEEDNRVDVFYRITFPDTGKDEPNFDSGIENPSFDCSSEDVRTSGSSVRYSPM